MSRFDDIAQFETGPGPGSPTPGDDWLSRINALITNAKELFEILKEFRGAPPDVQDQQFPPGKLPSGKSNSPPNPGINKVMLVKFLDLVIQRGYGDKTIGELIEKVSPLTIKQIAELIKSA